MRIFKCIALLAISIVCGQHMFALDIIPYPLQVDMKAGVFDLAHATRIVYAPVCRKEAGVLQELLENEYGLKTSLIAGGSPGSGGSISLAIDATSGGRLGKEGYELTVDKGRVQVRAATTAGVFYAIQTLRQLVDRQGAVSEQTGGAVLGQAGGAVSERAGGAVIPCCHIVDKPRFAWRSFMLDEGRYFKGEKVVKQLLDDMAFLKMNVFHWHLTDDQGWRIEIKKYPLLTTVGSRRDSTQQGVWPSGWGSTVYDGVPHQGYYTHQQIKDIIRYAADRHITIVPEIEMPGHASAAIASYPFLGAENKPIRVPVKFGVQYNIYNVADPRVQRFIQDVLDEVMALFPSKVIHIGGDEVKYDQWKNSSQVQLYMQQQGLASPADLQVSFTNHLSQLMAAGHRRMMGWNEILGGKVHDFNDNQDAVAKQKLSRSAIVQFWTGDTSLITQAAEAGYDIVNSLSDYTYLDYDDKSITLEKAYSFEPVPASLPRRDTSRILGLGCQMWGEWIPSVERMEERVYPRIAAYAETGWTSRRNKDYGRFSQGLAMLEAYWTRKGVHFTASK